MTLPLKFFLRRDADPESPIHTLVETHNGFHLSFSIHKNKHPNELYKRYKKDGSTMSIQHMCVRQSSSGPRFYDSIFCYTGYVVLFRDEEIPIWDMNNACKLMPGRFVLLDKYPNYQFLCLTVDAVDAVDAVHSVYALPSSTVPLQSGQRLGQLTEHQAKLRAYHQTHTEDTCPITMEAFQEQTLALTPCEHGFNKRALCNWISLHQHCPVCRTPCSTHQLVSWN